MEFLGTVEEITTEGRIVVRAVVTPEPGDNVFDQRNTRIGTVKRIFGPVDSPYVSVVPLDRNVIKNISGKKTYFEGATRHGKNKRRN